MQILKPILNGITIIFVIVGLAMGLMVNLITGLLLVILAMTFFNATRIINLGNKLARPEPVVVAQTINPQQNKSMFSRLFPPAPQQTKLQQPQIITEDPGPWFPPVEPETRMDQPKPQQPEVAERQITPEEKLVNDARKLAEDALKAVETTEKLEEEKRINVASKMASDEPIKESEITPKTKKAKKEIFKCKKCEAKGEDKQFPDKAKLQRHMGMAHYKDLEV